MPPATSIPRETRAQSRKSRARSDGTESIEAPSSATRKATTTRRKPNVGPKPSSNYGAAIDSQAPAQKQAAKLAKTVATDRIEAGVGAAIERSATVKNNTKGLTAVPEEGNRESLGDHDLPPLEEEWMAFNDNSRGGESEGMDYHHTASDLTGSNILGRQTYLNAPPNRQPIRDIPQQSTASDHAATPPNRDAVSIQPDYQSQHDMSPPPPVQASIQHPTLTNSSATAPPSSREAISSPGIWKWMFMALVISVLVSLSSAVLSTVRYYQITTSLSDFQNGSPKVPSIIPTMFGQRLDKLEEQVARLVENAVPEDARSHQINWFSFDLGARANPYLSSPSTRGPNLKIKGRWSLKWKDIRSAWRSSQRAEDLPAPPLPPLCEGDDRGSNNINPNAALTPYSEFEPRYCAPFSGRGKLQLAVSTPRPITPTELVVEHFRKDQILRIGSAPKEIELWIQITDDGDADADADAEKLRDDIRHRISAIYPDIFSRTYTQKDRLLDPKMALGPDWVPVGRWTYQISSHENVQYFGIPLDLVSMGVVARQHVVRVNSNWGNVDRTCLVRVGLHGKDASAPNEYLEDDEY